MAGNAIVAPTVHPIVSVLVTFGLFLVIEDLVRSVWGRGMLTVSAPAPIDGVVKLGEAAFPTCRLVLFGLKCRPDLWISEASDQDDVAARCWHRSTRSCLQDGALTVAGSGVLSCIVS